MYYNYSLFLYAIYLNVCCQYYKKKYISVIITVISWRSVLLEEETGIPGENHRPVTSHYSPSNFYKCSEKSLKNPVFKSTIFVLDDEL
jgi:hypothetical protein